MRAAKERMRQRHILLKSSGYQHYQFALDFILTYKIRKQGRPAPNSATLTGLSDLISV